MLLIPPVQTGTAIGELPERNLSADIQCDDIEDIALGTICHACIVLVSDIEQSSETFFYLAAPYNNEAISHG
jgi:hypothetical protein